MLSSLISPEWQLRYSRGCEMKIEIKNRYLRAYPNKKDFIKQMSVWVKNPNEETSIMQEGITKYKIMPNLAYDIGALEDIAAYIYDTDFLTNKN